MVASANFYPPGCERTAEVLNYLRSLNIPNIAITQGSDPILYVEGEDTQSLDVPKFVQ